MMRSCISNGGVVSGKRSGEGEDTDEEEGNGNIVSRRIFDNISAHEGRSGQEKKTKDESAEEEDLNSNVLSRV